MPPVILSWCFRIASAPGLFEAGTHRLQIVWFQDGWALPIEPAVIEELGSLDFMAVAFDEVSTW